MKKLALSGLLVLLALPGAAPPLRAADPFYTGLLRDGIYAYDRGDATTAVRHLRLACFGLLEEPEPLADCLVRLALAQDKSGNAEGFRDTFRRVIEVEERFGAYRRAQVPAELRALFEQRTAALIPAATLASVPAFQGLAARKPEAEGPARNRRGGEARSEPKPAAPGPAAPSPSPAGTAGGRTTPPAPPAAAPSTTPTPTPTPAPAAPALSEADQKKMADARRLLASEASKIRELRQAFQLAKEVADTHPGTREAQHLAAEAAYRSSRWADASAYFRRGGEPGADQPELLFYMAVALYESGDRPGAANALRRSLSNLQRTPYVDGYAKKILGETGAP
jgi:tetratricopeptide (TPR) repeat protein